MILVMELILIGTGLYSLVTGKFGMRKEKIVTGAKARILGAMCLSPIPLTVILGIVLRLDKTMQGEDMPVSPQVVALEFFVIIGVLLLIYFVRKKFLTEQQQGVAPPK